MNAIAALKSACKASASFKNFREIEIGVYNIEEFKFVVTKYGKKLVVRTEEFLCFLPDRCSRAITTDQQLVELNNGAWAMKYSGRDAQRGNCILVDIVERQQNPEEWEYNDIQIDSMGSNNNIQNASTSMQFGNVGSNNDQDQDASTSAQFQNNAQNGSN